MIKKSLVIYFLESASTLNPSKKRKITLAPSFKSYESKGTQTDPFHPVKSLYDGLSNFDLLFQMPIGYVQTIKIQNDDFNGSISEFYIAIKCTARPPNYSRLKTSLQGLYYIQVALGSLYGMAPDMCSLPIDNPVVNHLLNPENTTNYFTCSELENVLNGISLFDWFNYRQLIILLQRFFTQKISDTLFQPFGYLYQVVQSPNHYIKTLTYDNGSIIHDHMLAIVKIQNFLISQFSKMSQGMLSLSSKCEEKTMTATSEMSLRFLFALSPSKNISEHSKLISKYKELHVASSSHTVSLLR